MRFFISKYLIPDTKSPVTATPETKLEIEYGFIRYPNL
jgi:hypothetical protein